MNNATDSRITEVFAIWSRVADSSMVTGDADYLRNELAHFVLGIVGDGFTRDNPLPNLPLAGLRALLETHLRHTTDLNFAVAVARASLASLIHAEAVWRAEAAGSFDSPVFDYPARLDHEIEIMEAA